MWESSDVLSFRQLRGWRPSLAKAYECDPCGIVAGDQSSVSNVSTGDRLEILGIATTWEFPID